MNDNSVYVVTDAEFDGPTPGRNSMLSFASVAVAADGRHIDTFEAVLAPLDGATTDPGVMAWFATQPGALADATQDPQPAVDVMRRFTTWVRSLPGSAVFTSHPLALDGVWMDFYLCQFTGDRLMAMPRAIAPLFPRNGLCLHSFAAGRLGWPLDQCQVGNYPTEWLGDVEHTHRAIDDARGYAHLLVTLLRLPSPGERPIPQAVP